MEVQTKFKPMDLFSFKSQIEYFIKGLLKDPINTVPNDTLIDSGFDNETLLEMLKNNGIISIKEKIIDHDKDKRPVRAVYSKKIHVEDNPEMKIRRLWQKLYQQNINESLELTEDGEGCEPGAGPGASASGQYTTTCFPMMRRVIVSEEQVEMLKKHILDEMATSDAGNYQFDVPLGVKKGDPTMSRHSGKCGSISIPTSKI